MRARCADAPAASHLDWAGTHSSRWSRLRTEKQCAITGTRIRPVLQAAHIRPVRHEGQHSVDNGLWLRADVHLMFDTGYLGVHPTANTLHVSPKLRGMFGNGAEFYARANSEIRLPEQRRDRPNPEFLQWHLETVYM